MTRKSNLQNQKHRREKLESDKHVVAPEKTAVRTALWRALHLQVDSAPPVLSDAIGLKLIAPPDGWQKRLDMNPAVTARSRATVVARARFVEDLVAEHAARGVSQYVLLGAGLDTFSQRRGPEFSSLRVFEMDQPGPQAWKRERLVELGFGIPGSLHLVPLDFEASADWKTPLVAAGFDAGQPAVVASTGVAVFLSREAVAEKLRQVAALATGTTLAMTFLVPLDLLEEEERAARQMTEKFAAAAGTPWLSFFAPSDLQDMARAAGFNKVELVSSPMLAHRYFSGRADGLRPSSSEEILVATV